jgi:hypothetical protein
MIYRIFTIVNYLKIDTMRFLIFILISLFCFVKTAYSQEEQMENDPDQLEVVVEEEEAMKELNDVNPKRLQTHMEVGTSFTYSPHNFYGPSIYAAPSLSYLVTPRLTLSVGFAVERSNLYLMESEAANNDGMLPMTRAYLFARGTYMLTSKLALSGSVYKTINDVPRRENVYYPYNYNYQGMSLGLNYKFNNSFSVGFHVSTQSGNFYNPNGLIPPSGYVYVPGF